MQLKLVQRLAWLGEPRSLVFFDINRYKLVIATIEDTVCIYNAIFAVTFETAPGNKCRCIALKTSACIPIFSEPSVKVDTGGSLT